MVRLAVWVLVFGLVSCASPGAREQDAAGKQTEAGPDVPVGIEVGQRAPEILLPDPNGKEIALSSLRGKVVVLDFWAAWWGRCRGETPNIVTQYKRYKDERLTVYSVSLDLKKEDWVNAIEDDGLVWPNHVSDLKFWYSEPAEEYRIEAIPASFLLDENGVIIARDLRGPELASYLSELFRN